MNYKEALKDKDYRFRYIYLDGKKVGVVVMLRDGKVGMSFCSPRDQFHKAKGRFMAYQRAVKGKKIFCPQWLPAGILDVVQETVVYLHGIMSAKGYTV